MNKLCFPPALFEVGFAGGCAEGESAGGGISTSAGATSAELDDPRVDPPVTGRSHSGKAQLRDCGCLFHNRCFPILDEL